MRDTASHQRLSIDLPPIAKPRQCVDGDDFLDMGGLVDRGEQTGAAQVRRDDLAYIAPTRGVRQPDRDEIRDRNRHRLDVALGDVELQHRRCRAGQKRCHRSRHSSQHDQPAAAHGACRRGGADGLAAGLGTRSDS